MNHSVSTITGKIKIKIVFLGNQSVGKSSVIEKYVNNRFDESSHVTSFIIIANCWYRLSGKECLTQKQDVSYSVVGYCRTITIQVINTLILERRPMRLDTL